MALSSPVRADGRGLALGTPFVRALGGFLRAYQLQAAVLWALRLLALGLGLDLAALLVQRLSAGFDLPLGLLALPPLFGGIVGVVFGGSRRPSLGWLASEVDHRLGLNERTLTALELIGRGVPGAGDGQQLGREQIADSIAHLRRAEPLDAFPLRLPRREAVRAIVLTLALVPLILLNPMARNDRATPRLDAMTRGEAERISALADELDREEVDDAAPVNPQAASLLRQVADAVREAQGDADRAMAKLGDGERRLSALQRPGAVDAAAAMSRLADALDREARTRPVANALDQRDYRQAAQETRNLGAKAAQGSEADRQAISRALDQAANGAARYDEKLAQALRDAAERTGRGESGATERAAQEMSRAGNELSRQETLERAMSQLQNSRQALGNAADQQRGSAASQAGRPNRGQSGSQGGDERGQGEGGDRGAGQGDPSAGENGESQSGAAGTGTQARSTDLYNPTGVRSRQVQVPGGDFDRPQITEGDQTDSPEGEARVDYRDVLPNYQERATKAMQDRYIPLGMKDLVRDYFSSLQPGQSGGR